jgi:VIT1/CCC1 family predicted Fe2+/Mn2+ transporter
MNAFPSPHPEIHKSHRAAWLRAAVLGMNDGIVSTSSLMLGVLAASGNQGAVILAGMAGVVAGALSMAAGEYVSVSSQRDSELSDIAIEMRSLTNNPDQELQELAWIYERRGLDAELAKQVAKQLHDHDAVRAHAHHELGIDHDDLAKPAQAAIASGIAFLIGGAVPILAAVFASNGNVWTITIVSLVALFLSGAIGALIGGGRKVKAALRVFIGGGLAMAVTYGVGHLIGASL